MIDLATDEELKTSHHLQKSGTEGIRLSAPQEWNVSESPTNDNPRSNLTLNRKHLTRALRAAAAEK